MNSIRVLLADDHSVVRAGIRAMLLNLEGIDVVAEANDGREALALIQTHQPHVILTDIAMPEMNGLELTAHVAKEFPHMRVIVISMHTAEGYVRQALRAGASGYLLKFVARSELEFAIRSVVKGTKYLTPTVSTQVVDEYIQRSRRESSAADILTARQREILQFVTKGKTTKEIARIVGISVKTVETHRKDLMDRLDIHDIPGLVRYAMRVGLVSAEG